MRFVLRRDVLEMLLTPREEVRVRRVPLLRGRDVEAGELTLSRTGRTLEARLFDPPRLLLGKAEDARDMLRGRRHAAAMFEATDDDTTAPPPARVPSPAAPAREVPPVAPLATPETTLDEVMRGVHACPQGLTCRPGHGVLFPLAPQGLPHADGSAEVLLVGWNPRTDWYARRDPGGFDAWRGEAERALATHDAADDAWARRVGALLPPPHSLRARGVMRTFVWKWPTRLKASGPATDVYARRCIERHLGAELAALRPRALVTYETEAAEHVEALAAALGIEVKPPGPSVRAAEALGWAPPSEAWGWPMALVLLKDAQEPDGYDGNTVRYAHAALAKALA